MPPCRELQTRFSVQNNRTVPDWGKAIFSTECVLMRPTDGQQIAEFLKYAIALSEFHVQVRCGALWFEKVNG